MVDMKYHLASLVAVFLALGVGILVGSAMVTDTALVERQEQMIDRLEEDFARLKAEREDLGARLAASERALAASLEFEESVVSSLTQGRLSGRRIAVVVCRDAMPPEKVERIGRSLEDAGARVVRVVYVNKNLVPAAGREAREAASLLGVSEPTADALGREAARALASYIALDEASPLVDALFVWGYAASGGEAARGTNDPMEAGVILRAGDSGRADAVVVLVGSSDPASGPAETGIPIVRALMDLGVDVVGAESWDVKVSHIADYKREGISTVDCADLPLGRLSLVHALAGQKGHFGIKGASGTRMPDIWGPPE